MIKFKNEDKQFNYLHKMIINQKVLSILKNLHLKFKQTEKY